MKDKNILVLNKASNIRFRKIYSAKSLDDFKERTFKHRKYFFRNIYLIHENIPHLGIQANYLELRTFRTVYRYYFDGDIY